MHPIFEVKFLQGSTAKIAQIHGNEELPSVLEEFDLATPRPVLVVIGGASEISPADLMRVQLIFEQILAPLADDLGLFIVDGGTDAGVMQLIGQARTQMNGQFPLLGVAPIDLVRFPGFTGRCSEAELEPNHTHFILVPGSSWGDESPWLAQIATQIAAGQPTAAILINGGKITLVDLQHNLKEGRSVVVVAGSGRLADNIALAVQHPEQEIERSLLPVLDYSHLHLFDLSKPFANLRDLLKKLFSS